MDKKLRTPPPSDVILIKDLAPRAPVKGGAGKLVFGQAVVTAPKAKVPAPKK